MRVNKRLLAAIDINPSKSTQLKSVQELVVQAIQEEILLPQYQTGIRWTIKKCVDLLNYQLSGKAPVSAVSMHEIGKDEEVTQVNFINRKIVEGNLERRLSTTDGQQRISCNLKAYINDPTFSPIVLDLNKGEFIINYEEPKKNYQIPVGILLNKDLDVLQKYTKNKKVLQDNFQVLVLTRSKMLTYNYVINIGKGMTKTEQLDWFEKLNNAGSKIPKVQLKLTELTKNGIDIYAEYTNKFMDLLEMHGYSDIFPMKNTEFSIPIALLNPYIEVATGRSHSMNWSPLPSDVKVREICKLRTEDIRTGFEAVLECLEKAILFLYENNIEISRIDYLTYLTGYFIYIKDEELTEEQHSKLIKWIKNIDFDNKTNSERRAYFTDILKI